MRGRLADCLEASTPSVANVGTLKSFLSIAGWFLWQPVVIDLGIISNVCEGTIRDAVIEKPGVTKEGDLL